MTKKPDFTAPSILDALAAVTEDDLQALTLRCNQIRAELNATEAALRLVTVRLHGKPKRNVRQPKKTAEIPATTTASNAPTSNAPAESDQTVAEKVYDQIAKSGPLTLDTLAARLLCSVQSVRIAVAKSAWFSRNADGRILIRKVRDAG